MNPQLMQLIQLQDITTQILEAEARRDKVPMAIARLEEKLTAVRKSLEAHKAELKESETTKLHKQAAIHGVDQRLNENKSKQFRITNSREFDAITNENASLYEEKSTLEDELLQLLDRIEELHRLIGEEEALIKSEEAVIEADRKRHLNEMDGHQEDVDKLYEQAAEIEKHLPARFLTLFKRIAERRQGSAVVECVDGICQGCRMKSRLQVWTEIARNNQVYQCFSCQRILYKNTKHITENRLSKAEPAVVVATGATYEDGE